MARFTRHTFSTPRVTETPNVRVADYFSARSVPMPPPPPPRRVASIAQDAAALASRIGGDVASTRANLAEHWQG